MNTTNTTQDVINQLQKFNISTKMKSLESSDWIVYETVDNEIVGAAGMGGIFHTSSININTKFRGKGYGGKIQKELVDEAIKRNYSFVTVFVDPRNDSSTKLHNELGYETVFRIHFSKNIIQDIKIIIFKKRGITVKKFLKYFNTKIGIFFLAYILKILRSSFVSRSLFKKMLAYDEKEVPIPDIKWIIKKFEKISG